MRHSAYHFAFQVAVFLSIFMGWGIDSAAQKSFQIRHFEESQGLSSNFSENVIQCLDGKLMVSGKQGVDLFDGIKFVPILQDSNRLEYVTSIHRANDRMWLGQFDGRIIQVDGQSIKSSINTGIEEQIIYSFTDSTDVFWSFSRSGKVFWINRQDTALIQLPAEELLLNAVCNVSQGVFLVGSNDGLFKVSVSLTNKNASLTPIARIPASRINALYYHTAIDLLWVGTEDAGLWQLWNPESSIGLTKEFQWKDGSSIDNVQSIFKDRSGRLWLGQMNEGLKRIEFHDKKGTSYSVHSFDEAAMQQHQIRGIFEDNESTIWVATFGGGIFQIIDKIFNQPYDENWLKQQSITQLYKDRGGNVWLGIDKGIFRTVPNGLNDSYTYYHVGGQTVTSITENADGTLWVGTASNGVYLKSSGASDFRNVTLPNGNLANSINSIAPRNELMHVSTKDGLYILNDQGKVTSQINTLDGLPHNNVRYAVTDSKGITWIANQGNRISYLKDGKISFLEESNAQSITDVYHILEDKKGRLWFTTLGSGMFVLDNGTAQNISEQQGLPSNYCYQMEQDDDGNIWVSHQKSVTQITPDLKVARIIGHQDISPVANTMITFLFKDDEGNIWITSTHGVVKYNPRVDKASRSVPLLSISAMRVFEMPVEMKSDLELPFNQYSISFDLSGISLRNPESIRYKYQLLGFSDVWSEEFTSGTIQFPKLEDGEYTLNVIASKNGGEWSTVPTSYSFVISKPFWRTLPFYIVSLIVIVAGIAGFVRYRTFKLVSDKQELEIQVSQRTLEIQQQKEHIEQSRDEIARYAKDITDSIKYAQRIQSAIFPAWDKTTAILPDSFVFFRSKDIVSGDFFYAEKVGNISIFAAVDCTGHGVPGGFMSIVANNLLNQAVKQMGLTKPSEILDFLNEGVTNTLHQTYEESSVKDGMDISICALNLEEKSLQFAGAYNPMYLFRDNQLSIYKGDRFPVGMFVGEEGKAFTNTKITVQTGDVVYIFSDGFADQFGGTRGKKMKLNGFRDILREIHNEPMSKQSDLLALKLEQWKGNLEQVDDIVVMGVRVS